MHKDNEKKIRSELLLYLVYTNFRTQTIPERGSLCIRKYTK